MARHRQKVHSTAELSRKITWKIALSNLLAMLTLFILCMVALNVSTNLYITQQIDKEIDRQLQGFTRSHLYPEEHSQRLPAGLLPIIYFYDRDSGYINPHPAESIIEEDVQALLASELSDGFSNQTINGNHYRIYRVEYDPLLTFWELGTSYQVSETVSIQDIQSETAMFELLAKLSAAFIVLGALIFTIQGYLLARRALVPINRAWENQRRFVADTSHELRNPLAIVQTNAELLLNHPENTIEEESERISAILESSSRMSGMLATLLTLARSDANEEEILHEQVDLSAVLTAICEQFIQIAAAREVTMSFSIESGLYILGDKERIIELFSILLDNAIRYSGIQGTVQVMCYQTGGTITVYIVDNGIGISPEDLSSVFNRFYRGDIARSVNPGGTGLGLSIAHWIAERHNAEIQIESEEGEGTRITLKFVNPYVS
ncbi:MAG: sensor histidine kinase [Actinobacteria bacterium]|nr:sensor histidine kinase [Actinomycetota bacterium]